MDVIYRLAAEATHHPPPSVLEELARLMTGRKAPDSNIPAGYTYLGQFIDHDLSFVSKGIPDRDGLIGRESDLKSDRTPALDLDSVFYPHGSPTCGGLDAGSSIARESNGRADFPDVRNEENFIVSRLHRVFLSFWVRRHAVLKLGGREDSASLARQETVRAYHRVILDDFLPKLCGDFMSSLDWSSDWATKLFPVGRLPIEFVGAAFRFGHAMVLPSYQVTADLNPSLEEILSHGDESSTLFNIDPQWNRFFESELDPGERVQNARAISPALAGGLGSLTVDDSPNQNLALLNLLRGRHWKLPDGQSLARELQRRLNELGADSALVNNLAPLEPSSIKRFSPDYDFLVAHELHNKIPLWYYLLLEAAVSNEQLPGEAPLNGSGLGPLGGFIVAGVLTAAMKNVNSVMLISLGGDDAFNSYIVRKEEFLRKKAGAVYSAEADRGKARMIDFIEYALRKDEIYFF